MNGPRDEWGSRIFRKNPKGTALDRSATEDFLHIALEKMLAYSGTFAADMNDTGIVVTRDYVDYCRINQTAISQESIAGYLGPMIEVDSNSSGFFRAVKQIFEDTLQEIERRQSSEHCLDL